MEVGLRVVRGPDWKYGEQDGGEGHVGTVVELGEDSTSVPDDCVVVLWDSGIRKTYRAGHEGCFDLLVLDNGPCGTKHPGINCDSCKVEVISGIRWRCRDCINYDLCTKCYMSDKDDVTHTYKRIYSPSVESEDVGRRCDSSQKKVARGIFTGATVCRGCDWKWGNQDGGDGTEGSVLSIGDWEGTYRSLARVKWSPEKTNNYRVGSKGSVDLRYVAPASGGSYYKDHLPVLGKSKKGEEEGIDLASVLALGLLQQTVMRPLQNMFLMHGLLGAMQEMTPGSSSDLDVGTRVVRGPDWKWQNQDGGEGCVGTVVDVGGPGVNQPPEKCVKVVWDHGESNNYRAGYDNAFDLRIYDNAQCGVVHVSVACDECNTSAIRGIRWKCTECANYDLCHSCYMNDKHLKQHKFHRIVRPNTSNEPVSPRSLSTAERVQARGIFKGAVVVRGPDWRYEDQDGKSGTKGEVDAICDWDQKAGRNEAKVTWSLSKRSNSYRVGFKGKVDVKYVRPSNGLMYYRNHLPVFKITAPRFEVGDQVICNKDIERLKALQDCHGGWCDGMEEYIKKKGKVIKIDSDGDVHVVFEDLKRWCYNPDALDKCT